MFRSKEKKQNWRFQPDQDDPRRRARRHVVDALTCDLGTVIDLSTVGMRVSATSKPPLGVGQIGRVKLKVPEGNLALTGRVVWIKRTGLRRWLLGIEFLNVKKSIALALDSIAQFGFIRAGVSDSSATSSGGESRQRKSAPKVRATIDIPDYYKVLGIDPSTTDERIREAFRDLARKYHPDVTDDPDGPTKFLEIQEAYEVLRDADRRKSYDMQRAS